MLSSALIGCFTALLNVKLCSDWLFHSATHQQEGNTGRKIYIQILSLAFISLGDYTVYKKAVINTRGIETSYSFTFKRCDAQTLFILWSNSTYHTFNMIRRLSVVLRICKSFAITLILISLYSVYVVSEILCTVTGYS